jgi:hypothetical protein
VEIDPLVGKDDERKPLRSRLLAVPRLRAIYLDHVRTLAQKDLDWKNLQPVVSQYRALIEKEVAADTRKLSSLAEFQSAVADSVPSGSSASGRQADMGLRAFAEKRRAYLLKYPAIQKSATASPQSKPPPQKSGVAER